MGFNSGLKVLNKSCLHFIIAVIFSWEEDRTFAESKPTKQRTQKKPLQTLSSMLCMGFEPTTPLFQQDDTAEPLDEATTVITRT
jgi:hypothetical protein